MNQIEPSSTQNRNYPIDEVELQLKIIETFLNKLIGSYGHKYRNNRWSPVSMPLMWLEGEGQSYHAKREVEFSIFFFRYFKPVDKIMMKKYQEKLTTHRSNMLQNGLQVGICDRHFLGHTNESSCKAQYQRSF